MSIPACLLNSQTFTFDVGANTRDMHTCPSSIERPFSDVDAIIPDPGLPDQVKEARRVRFAEDKNQVKCFKDDDPIMIPEMVMHQKYIVHTQREGQLQIGKRDEQCYRPMYYIEILVVLCVIATILFFYQCPCYSITTVMIAVLFMATFTGCHDVRNAFFRNLATV